MENISADSAWGSNHPVAQHLCHANDQKGSDSQRPGLARQRWQFYFSDKVSGQSTNKYPEVSSVAHSAWDRIIISRLAVGCWRNEISICSRRSFFGTRCPRHPHDTSSENQFVWRLVLVNGFYCPDAQTRIDTVNAWQSLFAKENHVDQQWQGTSWFVLLPLTSAFCWRSMVPRNHSKIDQLVTEGSSCKPL